MLLLPLSTEEEKAGMATTIRSTETRGGGRRRSRRGLLLGLTYDGCMACTDLLSLVRVMRNVRVYTTLGHNIGGTNNRSGDQKIAHLKKCVATAVAAESGCGRGSKEKKAEKYKEAPGVAYHPRRPSQRRLPPSFFLTFARGNQSAYYAASYLMRPIWSQWRARSRLIVRQMFGAS